jgi:hypothetical protein
MLAITNMAMVRVFEVTRVYPKVFGLSHNEINNNNNNKNKHKLRSNTKGYGGKTR